MVRTSITTPPDASDVNLIGICRPDVEALITHRFPFADAKAAFELVADYRDGVVKAIVGFE